MKRVISIRVWPSGRCVYLASEGTLESVIARAKRDDVLWSMASIRVHSDEFVKFYCSDKDGFFTLYRPV